MFRIVRGVVCPALALSLLACGGAQTQGPASIRLVDRWPDATVTGSPALAETTPISWDFTTSTAPTGATDEFLGWNGIGDVAGVAVRDAALRGRTTGDAPLLWVAIPPDLLEDELHAIEVRMSVSAGEQVAAFFSWSDEITPESRAEAVDELHGSVGGSFSARIESPGEMSTLLLPVTSFMASSVALSGVKELRIRPTEAADAEFAIESIRVISRREHLQSIPSGLGWQDESDIFRETIVSRTPEAISFEVTLPSDPWMELHLGTIEPGPATFRVTANDGGRTVSLLERTLSTPERWEATPIDLTPLAGRTVTLTLAAEADPEGTIVYWGTPVIRQRGDVTRATAPVAARQAIAPDRPAPRGVIFILADTLRRDHLPWYGGSRDNAPNLARLAEEGAVFTHDVSQATWTKVSVSSILTSLYPSTHGIQSMTDRLPSSVTTLEELFQQAGYATFHTSSVPFTGRLTNLHQGAEVLHEASSVPEVGHSDSKTARTYTDRLTAWLETQQDSPFFVFLHAFDPHSPFEPYAPYDRMYMDEGEPESHRAAMETVKEHIEEPFMKNQGLPLADELQDAGLEVEPFLDSERDWYDASIRAMDVEVGRLLERLRELGRLDDTMIVFMSDHGEEFLEHGRRFHGYNVYGEMLNVPLMIWWPGTIPPRRIDDVVESIDVFPTIAELARLPVPEGIQGQSLLPLIAEPGAATRFGWQPRAAFAERAIDRNSPEDLEVESYAMIADGWKLIRNTTRPEDWPEYELYAYYDDPLDSHDVAADNPEIVERMAVELDAWLEAALAARIEEAGTEDMSPEELAKLRSLGYIQ